MVLRHRIHGAIDGPKDRLGPIGRPAFPFLGPAVRSPEKALVQKSQVYIYIYIIYIYVYMDHILFLIIVAVLDICCCS